MSLPLSACHFSNTVDVSVIPLALYIHIPWCIKKCPYCDFNSHALPQTPVNAKTNSITMVQDEPQYFQEYVTALIQDINAQLPLIQGRKISSIFIGGGTPSLLPISQYQRLFVHLQEVLPLAAHIEVTMEANPGTLEYAPFTDYLGVGINRLSIGVQSFADDKLHALGRIHNANQAVQAIYNARQSGFKRINIDLMHGLPNQTLQEALWDLKMAHHAGATHLSWYQLTIEPNTVFYRDSPMLPDEDFLADIEESGRMLLHDFGYTNYEVSAWVGDKDVPCRHNMNYWQFGDYLAIGAGAHGKVTLGENMAQYVQNDTDKENYQHMPAGIYRFSKSRLPKDYIRYKTHPKMVGWQPIAAQEISGEFMLNALRLTQGVSMQMYSERTGQPIDSIASIVAQLQAKNLLVKDKKLIKTTALGRRYLNQVLHAFL